MEKDELIKKLKSGSLTQEEESDLLDEFVGKKKKTPVQLEVSSIYKVLRKHPDMRPMGAKLISRLKSENDGRGKVPDEQLNKLRKAFKAALDAMENG